MGGRRRKEEVTVRRKGAPSRASPGAERPPEKGQRRDQTQAQHAGPGIEPTFGGHAGQLVPGGLDFQARRESERDGEAQDRSDGAVEAVSSRSRFAQAVRVYAARGPAVGPGRTSVWLQGSKRKRPSPIVPTYTRPPAPSAAEASISAARGLVKARRLRPSCHSSVPSTSCRFV